MTKHTYAFIVGVLVPTVSMLLAAAFLWYPDGGLILREVETLVSIWAVLIVLLYGTMIIAANTGKRRTSPEESIYHRGCNPGVMRGYEYAKRRGLVTKQCSLPNADEGQLLLIAHMDGRHEAEKDFREKIAKMQEVLTKCMLEVSDSIMHDQITSKERDYLSGLLKEIKRALK